MGEVGAAFVVVRPDAAFSFEDFRGFLRERLAKYKVPVHVHLVDRLPHTGSGKVQKAALKALHVGPVPTE
jgi:fatty-acyl-CoA synthase